MENVKITKGISFPLLRQDIRAQRALILVIMVIMLMMSTVINFAMSIMQTTTISDKITDAQEDFYRYLFVMASYNATDAAEVTGELSYDDFLDAEKNEDTSVYEKVFDAASEAVDKSETSEMSETTDETSETTGETSEDADFHPSVEGLEADLDILKDSPVSMDKYIESFEYVYALQTQNGVFSGDKLEIDNMTSDMLELKGISADLLDSMQNMDMTSLLNTMYFHVVGLLPIFLLVAIMANALLAAEVDRGSMAYILSTPTTRGSVVLTQALFMLVVPLLLSSVVCVSRLITTKLFFGDVCPERVIIQFVGFYLLSEAAAGLCFLGSCLFNKSSKALAFGGGLCVWFFLAAFLGVFGAGNLVDVGMGVEQLGIFNKLTITSLFDIDAIATIGTVSVNYDFVWKFAILGGIALITYIAGAVRFCRKDLPL